MDLQTALIRNADYTGPEYSGHFLSSNPAGNTHGQFAKKQTEVKVSFIFRLYSACSCCAQFINPAAVSNSSFLKNLMQEKNCVSSRNAH